MVVPHKILLVWSRHAVSFGEEVDRRAERGLKPVDWAGVVVARVRDDEDQVTADVADLQS